MTYWDEFSYWHIGMTWIDILTWIKRWETWWGMYEVVVCIYFIIFLRRPILDPKIPLMHVCILMLCISCEWDLEMFIWLIYMVYYSYVKFGMFINLTYKRIFGIFINNIMENFAYQEQKIDIFIRNIHGKIKIMIHTSSC